VRSIALVGALVFVALSAAQAQAPAARSRHATDSPLLGLHVQRGTVTVGRLDADTFALQPGGLKLRANFNSWSFAPDRSLLVLGSGRSTLLYVDPNALRLVREVGLPKPISIRATAWVGGHTLAVGQLRNRLVVLVVDPTKGVLARTAVAGELVAVARTTSELVLLTSPRARIGATTLTTVDGDGHAHSVLLRSVLGGYETRGFHHVVPGLAVDAEGRRAFAAGGGGVVAEVALAPLSVASHSIKLRRSVLSRLQRWLFPAADGKGLTGPVRQVLWLGGDTLALSGRDERLIRGRGNGFTFEQRPVGLHLVDTTTWTERIVARASGSVMPAEDLVVTAGVTDTARDGRSGAGLTVYDAAGTQLLHTLGSAPLGLMAATGTRALVIEWGGRNRMLVVDLADGHVVRSMSSGRMFVVPLAGAAAPCC
jgi:hypothetical protein